MLVFTLEACSDEKEPRDLPFEVRFACPEDHELTDELTLRVVREGCEGDGTWNDAACGNTLGFMCETP